MLHAEHGVRRDQGTQQSVFATGLFRSGKRRQITNLHADLEEVSAHLLTLNLDHSIKCALLADHDTGNKSVAIAKGFQLLPGRKHEQMRQGRMD